MAEVIGIVAAVFQIADLGARLSIKLYTFSHKVKHAKDSVESISKDISMTGNVLRQLGTELKKDEYAKLCTAEALNAAQSLVNECHAVFSDIETAIGGDKNATGLGGEVVMSFKNRLKFAYVQQQVEALQANLDRLKNSLLVMLNVLILAGQLKRYLRLFLTYTKLLISQKPYCSSSAPGAEGSSLCPPPRSDRGTAAFRRPEQET